MLMRMRSRTKLLGMSDRPGNLKTPVAVAGQGRQGSSQVAGQDL